MTAYYNEFDPYCAQWLRNLIDAGHIPAGDVDERSITEVSADEIRGYDQWHFFAGLGGWAYAARLAGLPDDAPILTGSPPCQPFSTAGQRKGYADERHLAPVWLELVATLRPAWFFGEQVAAAIKKDNWLDDLLNALEAEGYATGALVLPACGVGAPHIRQRLWVVARMVNAGDAQRQADGLSGGMDTQDVTARDASASVGLQRDQQSGRLADTEIQRRSRERLCANGESSQRSTQDRTDGRWPGSAETGWDDPDWLFCRDGKWRPVESGTFPLADGIPNRVGRLRAYGNAIVPQVAAEIIKQSITLDC